MINASDVFQRLLGDTHASVPYFFLHTYMAQCRAAIKMRDVQPFSGVLSKKSQKPVHKHAPGISNPINHQRLI